MHSQNDQTIKDVWKACADGLIPFEQAGQIQEHLSNMGQGRPAARPARRLVAMLFPPRRRQVSPDGLASLERRRGLGSRTEGLIPEHIAIQFSEAKRAVLMVIAKQVLARAACNLPIGMIAALAGVCCRTVQITLAELKRQSLVHVVERRVPGGKNATNVITIMSADWLKCLRSSIKIGCIGVHRPSAPRIFVHPTKNKIFSRASFQRVEPPHARTRGGRP